MIDPFSDPSPWLRGALALGLDVAVKSTLLLLAAAVGHLSLGRRHALVRSALWNAAMVGLLLLPVASAAFPRLRVDLLPAPAAVEEPAAVFAAPPAAVVAEITTEPIAAPEAPSRVHPASIVLAVYALVALVLLAQLGRSLAAVARLVRSGVAVESAAWLKALDRWRDRLGLSGPVRLARSDRVGVPVVVGWPRATILLPDGLVDSAGAKAIDAVLLHELAHVRRGDYPANLLLRAIQAIYWPQPLIWLAGRLIVGVREQACDDLCVYWMDDPGDYRATLLDVAAGLARRPGGALGMGLAMSRTSRLGRRLAWIARSEGAPRCLLRWPARAAIAAVVVAASGLAGAITLSRPAAASPQEPKPAGKPAPEKSAPADEDKPAVTTRPESKPVEVLRFNIGDQVVKAVKVRRGPFDVATSGPCSLEAFASAQVYAGTEGIIASTEVDIGDEVKRGQVLATIDAPEAEADLRKQQAMLDQALAQMREAEAKVGTAVAAGRALVAKLSEAEADVEKFAGSLRYRKSQLERIKRLVAAQSIERKVQDEEQDRYDVASAELTLAKSRVQSAQAALETGESGVAEAKAGLDVAKSGVKLAEADVKRAEVALARTKVVAPVDGIVVRQDCRVGELVRPAGRGQSPLFAVDRIDRVRSVANFPEGEIAAVTKGKRAVVRLDSLPGRAFEGKIARTSYAIDPKDRTFRVEVDLPNEGGKLHPGQFGSMTVILETKPDTLSVPGAAIYSLRNDRSGECLRVEDGRAIKVRIQVGNRLGDSIEIPKGLNEGDIILLSPPPNSHDKPVEPVESEDEPAKP